MKDTHLCCDGRVSHACLTLPDKLKLIFKRQESVFPLRDGGRGGGERHGGGGAERVLSWR